MEVTKQQVSSKNAISGVALLSTVRKRGDAIGMILDVNTMQICFDFGKYTEMFGAEVYVGGRFFLRCGYNKVRQGIVDMV